ncbi:hypothetical protein IFT48_03320 [Pseudomonas fluorescens]|uniref:hypothetical protein n=1 Tax=Pseudomonas fluorescens TaxID=294 RepID=UPI001930A448|nr:hypothetical protein [Pseudomonas fluorescens]MBD8088999.1 hypothetical protein [Pseudomonas fluorescens]
MLIRTCAHGLSPSVADLTGAFPRIAFVNASAKLIVPQQVTSKLLLVGADDISMGAIPRLAQWILHLPSPLSNAFKRLYLHQSAGSGYPAAPMAIADGLKIIEFIDMHQHIRSQELLISCEYGKSRSVTLAGVLGPIMAFRNVDEARTPNAWVKQVMQAAMSQKSEMMKKW